MFDGSPFTVSGAGFEVILAAEVYEISNPRQLRVG